MSTAPTFPSHPGLARLRRAAEPLTCLSQDWLGMLKPHRFRCAKGHEFERLAVSVVHKGVTSCPHCDDDERLARLREFARARGGQCLEGAYLGAKVRYRFVCAEGHAWTAFPYSIHQGSWCKRCATREHAQRMRLTDGLERLHHAAQAHGGCCLSTHYEGVKALYRFECARGHQWVIEGAQVFKGTWCGRCADIAVGDRSRHADGLERLRQAVEARGHQLVDEAYAGTGAKYRLRCGQGHEWSMYGGHILDGRPALACPTCLNLARLDQLRQTARARGGDCLESTFLGDVPHRFVCAHGHTWSVRPTVIDNGSWCRQCYNAGPRGRPLLDGGLERLQRIAQDHGGRCLSEQYTGSAKHYRFECAQGHQWEASGSAVCQGSWCRACARIEQGKQNRFHDGLQRLQAAAQAQGGQCLSQTYLTLSDRYRFRCAHGHEWDAEGRRILRGSWCLACAHEAKREGIEPMRALARTHRGRCLSETYINNATKLHWQCQHGHTWWAPPWIVKKGYWCGQCAKVAAKAAHRAQALERMQRMAAERGGRCLSDIYTDSATKLHWLCHRGHSWWATPNTVQQGSWCPDCASLERITSAKSKARRKYKAKSDSQSN